MVNPYKPKPEPVRPAMRKPKTDRSTQSRAWLVWVFLSAGCFLLPTIIVCIRTSFHESSAGMAMAPVEAIPMPDFVNPILYSFGIGFAIMAFLTHAGTSSAKLRLSWTHWLILAIVSFTLAAVDNHVPSICIENSSGDQRCFDLEIPYQIENVLGACGCLCVGMTLWAISRLRNKKLV